MFDSIKDELLTFANFCYLVTVLSAPLAVHIWFYLLDRYRGRKRAKAGLPSNRLIGPEQLLASQRTRALIEALSVVIAILVFPLIAPIIMHNRGITTEQFKISFAVLAVGVAVSGLEVIRSYVSGLLFYTSITLVKGVQVGDKATLLGHTGRITRMSPLFIQLETVDDDFVTLPTAKLWHEPVVSANAGSRSSLCVMTFHLSPFADNAQRRSAEDAIWESIQSSPYVDLGQRVEILLSQEPTAILMTAKAYVASTYRELEFKSDITSAFLTVCDQENIPLGTGVREISAAASASENHDD